MKKTIEKIKAMTSGTKSPFKASKPQPSLESLKNVRRRTVEKVKMLTSSSRSPFKTPLSYHLPTLKNAPEMASVIWEIHRALKMGIEPEVCYRVSKEAYFMRDTDGQRIAIFKPAHTSSSEMLREIVAYHLDYDHFAGVPPTVIADFYCPLFKGWKRGSCQFYVEDSQSLHLIAKNSYSKFSPSQVRRIAALDIRILNMDRHINNLLFAENSLVPIDHSFTLPITPHGMVFAWMQWPQAQTPFSPEELDYIRHLNPEREHAFLVKEMGIHEGNADLFFISTVFLKKGAERGLSPHQLGLLMKKNEKAKNTPTPFQVAFEAINKNREASFNSFKLVVEKTVQRLFENAVSQ